jgi:leucyl-tRNA synthetase
VEQGWPSYDPVLVVDDVLPYAVQVNGKLRAEIRAPAAAGEAAEGKTHIGGGIGTQGQQFTHEPRG